MGRLPKTILGFVLMLGTVTLACTIPGTGSSGPAPTPTAVGDSFTYLIPAYSVNLEPGDVVPGTRLEYLGKSGDTHEVRIDGQTSQKRTGDSFIWSGVVAPGVHATYNLRLAPALLGPLPVAGVVEVNVLNPVATSLPTMPQWNDPLVYDNIVLAHNVPVGWQIPGTTLVYEGVSTQGGVESARLSGLTGHPLFALGDSINWTGQLRDNVAIRYALRVIAIGDERLQLGGTAEMWVNQN